MKVLLSNIACNFVSFFSPPTKTFPNKNEQWLNRMNSQAWWFWSVQRFLICRLMPLQAALKAFLVVSAISSLVVPRPVVAVSHSPVVPCPVVSALPSLVVQGSVPTVSCAPYSTCSAWLLWLVSIAVLYSHLSFVSPWLNCVLMCLVWCCPSWMLAHVLCSGLICFPFPVSGFTFLPTCLCAWI